jgi:Spy/CpxP family protein refolding chaperone
MKLWTSRLLSGLIVTGIIASSTLLLLPANAGNCCKKETVASKGCPVQMVCMKNRQETIMKNWEAAVNLTPEQKTQVDAIRANNALERDKLYTQITEAKASLRRLMEANGNTPADETAVIAQIQALGSMKTLSEIQHIREAFKIKALLTPQQQTASKDFWKAMWEKKERMGIGYDEKLGWCKKPNAKSATPKKLMFNKKTTRETVCSQ